MKLTVFLTYVAIMFAAIPALFGSAADNPQAAKAKLDSLLKILPSIHWHASDACLRETTRGTFKGHPEPHDSFVSKNSAKVVKLYRGAGDAPSADVQLIDPEIPEEYLMFTFTYSKGAWEITTAVKHVGKTTMDLYRADVFMGSMKPYYKKALDAIAQRKSHTQAFAK